MGMIRAAKLCRYRVDVLGVPRDTNFSQFVVEAATPEDAMEKVTKATGAKRLKAHPITKQTLILGWLAHIDEKVRLMLNM